MKVLIKKVEDLKFAPYNPRVINEETFEKLKKSIKEFGYIVPIIYNKKTGNVIGGNQRLQALKDLNITKVEAIEVEMSEIREKALNIALNKIQGEWDYVALRDLLIELNTENFEVELTGFDIKEVESLIKYTKDINEKFEEYDEDIEKEESWIICPKCGHRWPL